MDKKKLEARKVEKAMRDLAALMQQAGVKSPIVENLDIKDAAREVQTRKVQDPYLEAEALLRFVHNPKSLLLKVCKREACKKPFGSSYHAVAYCSDPCRIKDLAEIGIQWDPHKAPEERWGGEQPLILPPAAIEIMVKLLKKSRRHQDAEQIQAAQNQTQNYAGEVSVTEVEQESQDLMQPIEAEARAAVSSPAEPEFSDVQQSSQSESDQEYNRQQDVQTPEDNPETIDHHSQIPSQIEQEVPVAKSVFDF